MQDEEDKLLTIQEIAERLRVDVSTVRRWVKTGLLSAIALPSNRNRNRKKYRVRQSVFNTIVGRKEG